MAPTTRTCNRGGIVAAALLAFAAAPAAAVAPDLLAFMQARAADGDGASETALARYAAALDATPGDPIVALHAYREGVEAGDLALARRAAAALGNDAPADATLLGVAEAARARDAAAADAAIARLSATHLGLLAAPLRAWAAVERGADPAPALAGRLVDPISRRLAEETRAMLLIARGRPEGLDALRALLRNDQASEDLKIAAARLLVGQGRVDAARSLLTGDAPALVAMRATPGPAATPTLAFGAGLLFARIASDLSAGPPGPLAIALAQAAVHADPANDRGRLLLAHSLARQGKADRALATLAQLSPDSIYAAAAATGRIRILTDAGREGEAVALAAAAAAEPDAASAAIQRHGDVLLAAGRPAEAAAAYRRLIDRDPQDWSNWLQYGGALEQAGDWRRAEPALARAVELAPEQPLALNYLGYARIERGAPVAPARALLERASQLAPDDPAITDSLAWAYHLGGDSARAVPLLERAAQARPRDAEIGEHLGDVYWATGRRVEARYAWRAAKLVADDEAAGRLSAKIAAGLPARR